MGFQNLAITALLMTTATVSADEPIKLWKPSGKIAHDPWKKFCGKTLCYDVLEVAEDATESEIRKSYRKLAREWHPDKNPEYGARAKFQKIAKAYETLSTEGERAKYDHLMANPAEYRKQYGEYYFKVVAPPSDVTAVIILLLVIASAIHYVILQQKKKDYNTKLIKLCVENRGPNQGGTTEVLEIHRKALERFVGDRDKNDMKKVLKNLKTDEDFQQVLITVLEEEKRLMEDPNLTSLAGFKMLFFPFWFAKAFLFQASWFFKHTIQGEPLSEEEKLYLLESNVENWNELSKSKQDKLFEKEAWIPENYARLEQKEQKKSK